MPRKIELVLPEPPSVNRIWRTGNGRTYKDGKARSYGLLTLAEWRKRFPPERWDTPLYDGPVRYTFHWYRSRKAGDLSNRVKVVEDALNGLAWADDAQVVECHLFRHEAKKGEGRVHITIEEAP